MLSREQHKQAKRVRKPKKEKSTRRVTAGLEKEPLVTRIKTFGVNFYNLYTPIELIVLAILFFAANYFYLHVLTKDAATSWIFGFAGLIFFFLVFSYQDRKLKRYQENLSDLLKYVNNMSFMLHSGENVLRSMEATVNSVNPRIQQDIEQTIDIMRDKAVLDTKHFEKYDFPSLNQFHQNLAVKYDRGGNAKELFDLIQKRMVNEMQKRDELLSKRKGMKMNIMTMIGMVLGIPVMMVYMLPNLWTDFLAVKLASIIIITSFYVLNLVLMHFMQKKAIDISVRL